jgi:hypothetical protein
MLDLLLLGFAKAAGRAVKAGLKEYERVAAGGREPSVSVLAVAILGEIKDYAPEHKGKLVLTAPLRTSLANSLAHLAFNIAAINAGKLPQ